MKTPMQQHMEWLHKKYILHLQEEETGLALEVWYCLKNAEQMLEKEKEYFMFYGYQCCQMTKQKNAWSLEELFNETFNTNESNT